MSLDGSMSRTKADWDTSAPPELEDVEMTPWIAIEPVQRASVSEVCRDANTEPPPSFQESQFDVILRRQRKRRKDAIKVTTVPSRFLNLSNNFEFAGWGSVMHTKLSVDDDRAGAARVQAFVDQKVLGQFTASALAGNAVLGSVFYALPAVAAVGGVYSPISLFTAALALFLWRPIMEELGSALPICGAPYSYIVNVSTKTFALVGASLLLLDFSSTAIVSAATAAAYLAGEVSLPFPTFVGTIIVLVLFTFISLCGPKDSARIALVVLSLHVGTMAVLIVAGSVHWGRIGNNQIKSNWHGYSAPSASHVIRQIFDGFCLGMLGLTGFECTPAYIARIKPGRLPFVLRNLHFPALVLNTVVMTLLLAALPMDTVMSAGNLLSLLAQESAGQWLRTLIVADAIIVLCGGVLTGILSACELFEQLSHDRVLPTAFLTQLPKSGAPVVSILFFVAFSGLIYATTGASVTIMSEMFSLVWLAVMALFPLSLLVLKFNRRRLPRTPRTSLTVVMLTLAVCPVVIAGNIAIDPATAGYFAAYFIGIFMLFSITQRKTSILRKLYWVYDQYPTLHRSSFSSTWGVKLVATMTKMQRKTICVLVKSDEINHIFRMISYVRHNEETSYLKIVHFVDEERGTPSELEANAKILDEAFPEITIDLLMVHASFEPRSIAALAHQLDIPTSLMFMSCPGPDFLHSVADLGTRIITR